MTTKHQPPPTTDKARRISLRALARELNVNHSSLSAAAHDGRLTRGIRIDKSGKVVVIDADAAAKNWHGVHAPQILEVERAREKALATAKRLAAKEPESVVLTDVAMGCEITARQLFEERDVASLLACALTADALDGCANDAMALRSRISNQLHNVAELHGADDSVIGRAEVELDRVIELLAVAAEDEE